MTDSANRPRSGGEEGAAPVRLIPRPDPALIGAGGSGRSRAGGHGLLDLMESAEGRRARVEINLSHGLHTVSDLQVLDRAVEDFLRSCGFEPDPARPPEAGTWFCRNEYWLASALDPAALARVFRAALVDLMNQAQSQEGLVAGARNSLIEALVPFPSAVLLLGCLLIVKTHQAGRPVLVVCPVSEDLRERIDSDPSFLRDPDAVLAFLDRSPWLMPVPRWTRTAAPGTPVPAPAGR